MDVGHLLGEAWPYAIVAVPGIFAAWKAWSVGRRDLVKIAHDAAASVIGDLRKEIDRSHQEIDRLHRQQEELEREFAEFRRTHDTMIADKDAEIALLRGRLREAEAIIQAQDRLLDRHGIPHEHPRSSAFWGVPAGSGPADLVPGQLPPKR